MKLGRSGFIILGAPADFKPPCCAARSARPRAAQPTQNPGEGKGEPAARTMSARDTQGSPESMWAKSIDLAVAPCDQNHGGHADEESGSHNAGDFAQFAIQTRRIANLLDPAVEDQVAVITHEIGAVFLAYL